MFATLKDISQARRQDEHSNPLHLILIVPAAVNGVLICLAIGLAAQNFSTFNLTLYSNIISLRDTPLFLSLI